MRGPLRRGRQKKRSLTPEGKAKAFLKHKAEVEFAKKRLVELEEEKHQADIRLLRPQREHKTADRLMMALLAVLFVLMGGTWWWVNGSRSYGNSARSYRIPSST